jgi:hypothetical protein
MYDYLHFAGLLEHMFLFELSQGAPKVLEFRDCLDLRSTLSRWT